MDAVISATNEQKQLLQDNGISSFIGKSSTSNGITVTAGQTIVDNYFAYLTFEVEGYIPEDEYQPDFMDMKIRIDGKEPEASFSSGFLSDSDRHDGILEYNIMMMSAEKGYFSGKPVHIEFNNMGHYTEKAGDLTLDTAGTWTFDWAFGSADMTESFELNAELGDTGVSVLHAELSPISVNLTYDAPGNDKTAPPQFIGIRR